MLELQQSFQEKTLFFPPDLSLTECRPRATGCHLVKWSLRREPTHWRTKARDGKRLCLATSFEFIDPARPKARALQSLQPVLLQLLDPIHCLFCGKPFQMGFICLFGLVFVWFGFVLSFTNKRIPSFSTFGEAYLKGQFPGLVPKDLGLGPETPLWNKLLQAPQWRWSCSPQSEPLGPWGRMICYPN